VPHLLNIVQPDQHAFELHCDARTHLIELIPSNAKHSFNTHAEYKINPNSYREPSSVMNSTTARGPISIFLLFPCTFISHAVALAIFISFCFFFHSIPPKTVWHLFNIVQTDQHAFELHCDTHTHLIKLIPSKVKLSFNTHADYQIKQLFITKRPTSFTNVIHLQMFPVPIFFSGFPSTYNLELQYIGFQLRFQDPKTVTIRDYPN